MEEYLFKKVFSLNESKKYNTKDKSKSIYNDSSYLIIIKMVVIIYK